MGHLEVSFLQLNFDGESSLLLGPTQGMCFRHPALYNPSVVVCIGRLLSICALRNVFCRLSNMGKVLYSTSPVKKGFSPFSSSGVNFRFSDKEGERKNEGPWLERPWSLVLSSQPVKLAFAQVKGVLWWQILQCTPTILGNGSPVSKQAAQWVIFGRRKVYDHLLLELKHIPERGLQVCLVAMCGLCWGTSHLHCGPALLWPHPCHVLIKFGQ